VTAERHKRARPPLDEEGLERLALFYAGRYATTRARLRHYLARKLKERGWGAAGAPPVERLVDQCAKLGYVDDLAFASARATSLMRRGFGEARVAQALRAAGIETDEADAVKAQTRDGAWAAALRFAERRRLGPYAEKAADRETRHRAAGAMLRAGHPIDIVRRVLDASPGDIPDSDDR
jgi:regulatory protein